MEDHLKLRLQLLKLLLNQNIWVYPQKFSPNGTSTRSGGLRRGSCTWRCSSACSWLRARKTRSRFCFDRSFMLQLLFSLNINCFEKFVVFTKRGWWWILLVFSDDELTTYRNKNYRFICNVITLSIWRSLEVIRRSNTELVSATLLFGLLAFV